MKEIQKLHYRPDIDVLRALSIFIVAFFHLGVPGFSGGFIGVDLFFVISGFLMTSIICGELETSGSLNFVRFCERRMRRILPALLAVLAVVTVASLVAPLSTIEAIRSQIMSSAIFTSNLYFWSEAGYFDTAAVTKPLLHTWSLSVEAQFYLFWPLFISLVWKRWGPKGVPLAIGLSAAVSFCSGLFFTDPEEMPTLFYMTPFRIFEFAIGGLLHFEKLALPLSQWMKRAAILLCVGIIAACTYAYSDRILFPAWNALLPCTAAAGFILLGKRTTFPLLFQSAPILAVGRLSYAIYLVHWPIIVFYSHLHGQDLDWLEILLLLLVTLAAAFALHIGVEHRFHRPPREQGFNSIAFGSGAALATTTVVAFAFFSLGLATPAKQGAGGPPDVVEIQRSNEGYTWRNHRDLDSSFASSEHGQILVIGDSQAADMVNLLLEYDPSLRTRIRTFVSTAGCQIKFSDHYYLDRERNNGKADETMERCRRDRSKFEQDKRVKAADVIILAYAWRPAAVDYLDEDVAAIRASNPEAKIYVAGLKTQPQSGIWFVEQGISSSAASAFAKRNAVPEVQQVNARLAQTFGENFLDIQDVICSNEACRMFTDSGYPIFFDASHLTSAGAKFLARGVPFYTLVGTRLELQPAS